MASVVAHVIPVLDAVSRAITFPASLELSGIVLHTGALTGVTGTAVLPKAAPIASLAPRLRHPGAVADQAVKISGYRSGELVGAFPALAAKTYRHGSRAVCEDMTG